VLVPLESPIVQGCIGGKTCQKNGRRPDRIQRNPAFPTAAGVVSGRGGRQPELVMGAAIAVPAGDCCLKSLGYLEVPISRRCLVDGGWDGNLLLIFWPSLATICCGIVWLYRPSL